MIGIWRQAKHVVPAIALLAGTTFASACGYEDLKGADAARGATNWAYPDALHVTSAVWRAQLDGSIPRDTRPKEIRALLGVHKTARDLGALRARLDVAMGSEPVPAMSILLIGPMLWTRYVPGENGLAMALHVDRAQDADIVVVTDEPVINALVTGRLTPLAARQQGLLRLYGTGAGRLQVEGWLDRLASPVNARIDERS